MDRVYYWFISGVILGLLILEYSPFWPTNWSGTDPTLAMAPSAHPVIVVGAGLAGLTASISALRAGASSVVLLERAARPGGNSIKASSGINGAPTKYQKRQEPDTEFLADTLKSAGRRLTIRREETVQREKLIGLLTGNSKQAVEFLSDDIGVDLSVVSLLGGHSIPRTHRGAGKTPPGAAIITALLNKLKSDERFDLKTGCEATRLVSSKDGSGIISVTGVEYHSGDGATVTLRGPVIFTTGGFAGDAHGLLAEYRPDLGGLPSTNDARPGMHRLLAEVGAQLVDMDSVQVHPTGFVDPADPGAKVKFLAAEMLRGEGGILLHKGKRFVNELETREVVSRAIMDLPEASEEGMENGESNPKQWDIQLLLDPGACEGAASHIGFYLWKGLVAKKKIGELDATTRETIKGYSAAVSRGAPDACGRTHFGSWKLTGTESDEDEEVCFGRVTPVVHFTMGGAVINEKSQILASDLSDSDPIAIAGLYAAGEITGGIHGDNRLGGSSLLECVVFGMIAGEQAAKSRPVLS